MPFIPHTPESVIPRSDSKNPAATCKGLTSNGRMCRRAIAKSPRTSPSSTPLQTSNSESFCWQHRDQALAGTIPRSLQSATIRERTSVDTLVDRLGFLDIEMQQVDSKERGNIVHQSNKGATKVNIENRRPSHGQQLNRRPRPPTKVRSNLGLFCCIGETDDERRAPRLSSKNDGGRKTVPRGTKIVVPPDQIYSRLPPNSKLSLQINNAYRPSLSRDPSSHTVELLSLIPASTSPQVTSLILSELAKPISEFDDDGFIYMFWLTSEALPYTLPSKAAPDLLATPSRPDPGQRRPSDVLKTFSSNSPNDNSNKKTVLLKIGRAQNVQRRLNQWTRQCGYNLSLIRYYPYCPASSSTPHFNEPPKSPRKVPNAHKVERLIHIELSEKRAKASGKCGVCGREHREWFEVEATRDGIRSVDEVVRRWVDWGQKVGC